MTFRRRVVLIAFGFGLLLGGVAGRLPRARAQSYVADTNAAPFISFKPEVLLRFWSQQAVTRGVTTDAQWNTAMQTLFAPASSPGVDPTMLAFLRSFFVQVVHVGVP